MSKRQFNTLVGFLTSKSSNPSTDDTVEFQGYDAIGVGASRWQHNGITGQTPSQSPTQLSADLLNDGDGNQWTLIFGQIVNFDGTQWFPLPFGNGGTGSYLYDENGWSKAAGINDLSTPYIFDTVALFKASLIEFPDGKTIHLNDRNADFTKITGIGTANTFDIIASTSVNQSIDLKISNGVIPARAIGAVSVTSGTPVDSSLPLQRAANLLEVDGGGYISLSNNIYGATDLKLKSNVGIVGTGFGSVLLNIGVVSQDLIKYAGVGADTTSTERVVGQMLKDFTLKGNPASGNGLVVQLSGATDNGTLNRMPTAPQFEHIHVTEHGLDGVVIGNNATFGAGNLFPFSQCQFSYNGGRGIYVQGQSNLINITNSAIHNNGSHGIHLNFITSTCTIQSNIFMDNGGWGVFCFSAEEPLISFNGFNRNSSGSIALSGNSTKYTEAAVVLGNLFGDNGAGAATQREVSITFAKGTTVQSNYFYGTGQDTMVYIGDEVAGAKISANHFKDLTTEEKLEVKVGAVNSFYTFEDDLADNALSKVFTNKVIENVLTANTTLFRNRADGNSNDFFNLLSSGEMNWGSGSGATDIEVKRVVAGSLRNSGSYEMQTMMIEDGITEPSTRAGYARMFVDSADGDLKIKFSDGTVKLISTDT